ncbi:cyclic nucleotide-binding domain-containing protein [Chitinimonas lacunae]|uniref:Cyclic nucleotide-binding domain-containing protein n=1 Tax=Chitinimonas lacunae TaxID=1963018 RepID=A0ABV8MKS7_9NEIS
MTHPPFRTTDPMIDYQYLGDAAQFLPQLLQVFGQERSNEVLDAESVAVLAGYMQIYQQPAGGFLLREGEKSDFLLLLLEGEVDVLTSHEDGTPIQISAIAPGRLIGEMSLVDGEPRFATCIARTDVIVAVLTRASLNEVLAQHPQLGMQLLLRLLALISLRLRQTSRRLVEILAKTHQSF